MPVNKVRRNGSYAPLSAHYYKDDAVAAAGEPAELLYVRGLAFCADVLSDGFISDTQLTRFVGAGMRDAAKRAGRLVEHGLWTREPGGYRVARWLKWNKSKSEIVGDATKDRERKPRGKTTEPTPDSDPIPNGIRTESEPDPVTSPNGFQPHARTPLHATPRQTSEADASGAAAPSEINAGTIVAAWVDAFTGSTGRKPSASMKAQAGREARQLLETDAGPGLVLAAAKAVGSKGLACVEREYAPLVAKHRQRAVDADDLTPERINQVLGPDREPFNCPIEIETGPPDKRQAWYRDEGERRLALRRVEAARLIGAPR